GCKLPGHAAPQRPRPFARPAGFGAAGSAVAAANRDSRVLRHMLVGLLIAGVVILALGLGVRLYMSRSAEDRLRPGEDIAIAEFRGPLPGNGSLACPEHYCAVAPDLASPAFPVEVDRLHALWPQALHGERGIVTLL